jgi:cupin fold WbuC family metalloprotein
MQAFWKSHWFCATNRFGGKDISKYKQSASGVWTPDDQFPSVSYRDLSNLSEEARGLPRKRSRICVHPAETDRLQEMFIAFSGDSYIRPSFHSNKDESIHFIKGRGKYVFFDDEGRVLRDVRLGPYDSDLAFYLRVPGNSIHSLIPLSSEIIAHEVAQGPFKKASTLFPDWATSDDDAPGIAKFLHDYSYAPVSPLESVIIDRISEEAYQCRDRLVYLRRSDIDRLKADVPLTRRKRIRILMHPGTDHALHEMLVVYTKATYVRPNLHVGKDESLHILEGEADFVFFDESGKLIEVVELSATDPGKDFFIRVPQGVFHTVIMRSEMLVIHEATPGPFNPAETLWAPWAPVDSDATACEQFALNLDEQIRNFR